MNLTLELQELDDLIVKHTSPPVTTILRNQLHPLWEQMEAYVVEKEEVTAVLKKTQADNAALKLTQAKESPGLISNMGVFWKRTATGFEQIPYCGECEHHPIMTPKWRAKIYICSNGHQAPIYVEPPLA
jgi:hypothetical protein